MGDIAMSLHIAPFDGPVGAAISAVDLSKELDEPSHGTLDRSIQITGRSRW